MSRYLVTGGAGRIGGVVVADVRTLVFSSTAAVHGDPEHLPIAEDARNVHGDDHPTRDGSCVRGEVTA
ncbi:hypothetical protein OG311_01675 [Streptomyces sp. NBC_01343]|uniref:hypothetical protein n=1 Tax=Streptomyces sp. NBC_01343 TaxID=2903832 RepID=UPI002E13EA02|nr:hypothetical protein OG311_01675 [Streptomyces sp. NBC_01343]